MNTEHIDLSVAEHLDAHEAATAQNLKLNICDIFSKVRPVLVFAHSILFFKPKWQTALTNLINAMDAACPTTTE